MMRVRIHMRKRLYDKIASKCPFKIAQRKKEKQKKNEFIVSKAPAKKCIRLNLNNGTRHRSHAFWIGQSEK